MEESQILRSPGLRVRDLVRFHTRHKLLLLAYSPAIYRELGRMVAGARAGSVERLADDYRARFEGALTMTPSRGRHVNVLQHIAGHFREVLKGDQRRQLVTAISNYQNGLATLAVPTGLLAHFAGSHRVRYVCDQSYLQVFAPRTED